MKKYSRIFIYLKDYKLAIASYFICTLLSIVFGIASLAMLFPFLQVLFVKDKSLPIPASNTLHSPLDVLKAKVGELINSGDSIHALSIVCLLIITSIVLKNVFLYLSSRSLMPDQ
jgi:subfamily B ATP-binding cassette protein MsbA